jgi:hypothetical protein
MPFLVRNVYLALDEPEAALPAAVAKRLKVPPGAIRTYSPVRRSLDARRDGPRFCYQVEVALDESPKNERARLRHLRPGQAVWLEPQRPQEPRIGSEPLRERPMIVGFGPGGMFAALRLATYGYRPLVLERGRDVRRRHRDVMQKFYREHVFDESSNLLFGEGGAGTYSDGKLYTRISDPMSRIVFEAFYHHGADPDILIDAHPHIGSDRLPTICTRIRRTIESLGGEIRFESRVEDIHVEDGRLTELHVRCTADTEQAERLPAGPVVLAVGHSARDTIRMLHRRGVHIVPKPFQIGVRIEHPQCLVDKWQYGAAAGHQRLGPAEYFLVATGAAGPCGDVFSFCMCPGGEILPSNESAGLVATNGASRSQRRGPFANSGLVLTLDPMSLHPEHAGAASDPEAAGRIALAALDYQEQWERSAYGATGATYQVPAQRACDFLGGRVSDGNLEVSYPLGGRWVDLRPLIPEVVVTALHRALPMLDSRLSGFAGADAIVTAPETRASAPVRILRDAPSREAVATAQLYPVGEGAGYAGGIVSAAVDGLKTADAIMARYAPPR